MKIKLVHLLCVPTQQREIDSANCLKPLEEHGFNYVQHVNPPYTQTPPALCRRRPLDVVTGPPYTAGKLWAGHYGAWLAHRRAFQTEFDGEFLMVCECDCWLLTEAEEFAQAVRQTCELMNRNQIDYVSLGNMEPNFTPSDDFLTPVQQIFRTHCILFHSRVKNYIAYEFATRDWDNIDFWLNWVMKGRPMAVTSKSYAVQVGQSLIDDKYYMKPTLRSSTSGANRWGISL